MTKSNNKKKKLNKTLWQLKPKDENKDRGDLLSKNKSLQNPIW